LDTIPNEQGNGPTTKKLGACPSLEYLVMMSPA